MSPRASKTGISDLEGAGQSQMFHATAGDAVRELARQYVDPKDPRENGVKAFAKRLFPHKSDEQAYTALMNCSASGRQEKFSDDEWGAILRIGHEQGRHFVAEYFCGTLYELTPVRREEIAKRARKQRIAFHLSEASRLAQEEE